MTTKKKLKIYYRLIRLAHRGGKEGLRGRLDMLEATVTALGDRNMFQSILNVYQTRHYRHLYDRRDYAIARLFTKNTSSLLDVIPTMQLVYAMAREHPYIVKSKTWREQERKRLAEDYVA